MKTRNLSILASLLLGVTMFGGNSSQAAPLAGGITNALPQVATENVVEKVRHRRRGRRRFRRRGRSNRTRNLLLGLGAAAIVGGAIANSNRNNRNAPSYRARPEPWSDAWYDYCFRRYRSFNPETGYFKSYSGRYIFCR